MKRYLKKAIRLSNYLSRGDTICRSAELCSLHPFMSLCSSCCCLSDTPSAVMSGSIVLIYCMVAWMEPGWNVSVRDEHLRCTEATKCSFRNGFQSDVVYMCSLLWQLSVVFSAAPVLPTALPSCPSSIICSYTAAANNKAICRKRGHSHLLIFPNHEEGAAIRLHSQFILLMLTAA